MRRDTADPRGLCLLRLCAILSAGTGRHQDHWRGAGDSGTPRQAQPCKDAPELRGEACPARPARGDSLSSWGDTETRGGRRAGLNGADHCVPPAGVCPAGPGRCWAGGRWDPAADGSNPTDHGPAPQTPPQESLLPLGGAQRACAGRGEEFSPLAAAIPVCFHSLCGAGVGGAGSEGAAAAPRSSGGPVLRRELRALGEEGAEAGGQVQAVPGRLHGAAAGGAGGE